jgi:hypothetical protein
MAVPPVTAITACPVIPRIQAVAINSKLSAFKSGCGDESQE